MLRLKPVSLQNGPNNPVHDSMTLFQTRFFVFEPFCARCSPGHVPYLHIYIYISIFTNIQYLILIYILIHVIYIYCLYYHSSLTSLSWNPRPSKKEKITWNNWRTMKVPPIRRPVGGLPRLRAEFHVNLKGSYYWKWGNEAYWMTCQKSRVTISEVWHILQFFGDKNCQD